MHTNLRWLHLSDFHVGKDGYEARKMFDRILEHVKERCSHGFVPDLLFVTGDVAQSGAYNEYEQFWVEFLWPLQELIGNGISERTFVVPGNHDADRKQNPAFDRAEMGAPQSRYFDPTEEGLALRQMLLPRFKQYSSTDESAGKGALGSSRGAFAEVVKVRTMSVGVVGVNTAWLSKDDYDERKLTPGKQLLEGALAAVESAHLTIVLGHHPISWFLPTHVKQIRSLLGKHRAVYLHGHLHDAWAEPDYGGGYPFLAVQSGAGFQAREGERWRNGLVWGEVVASESLIALQPTRWNPDQQSWNIATDAFHEAARKGEWWQYPLPGTKSSYDYTPKSHASQPPKGWSIFRAEQLRQYEAPLEPEVAVRFFDGALPDWPVALSASIPRRHVVLQLSERFAQADTAEKASVCLLSAAGCEGKTTALLQAAYRIATTDPSWRILHRRDDGQGIDIDALQSVLDANQFWLLLIDEADRVAADLHKLLLSLPSKLRGRVHCLLACRDSDWKISQAGYLPWEKVGEFSVVPLAGVDLTDARAVVAAWEGYGHLGLGEMVEVPPESRPQLFVDRAKEEAKTAGGAFFGALLSLRAGTDLRAHARVLLERLATRSVSGAHSLKDALAMIAVMHAEGLEFLSRPVLADALGIELSRLHREVLFPLGQEAAATVTSAFIFTRHRNIAKALVGVLEGEFHEDSDAIFERLADTALRLIVRGAFLPENWACWRFDISKHFFDTGRQELAVRLSKCALEHEPDNPFIRSALANLFRRADKLPLAQHLFREMPVLPRNRGAFFEWAVVEGEAREFAANAVLAVFSVSDSPGFKFLTRFDASRTLAGACVAFSNLFESYADSRFNQARCSAAALGLRAGGETLTKYYLTGHLNESLRQGAKKSPDSQLVIDLMEGLRACVDLDPLDSSVLSHVGSLSELSFNQLERIAGVTTP